MTSSTVLRRRLLTRPGHVALALGLRQGEVLGLRWSDVDLGLMGWSSTAMAARYQHITGTVRGDVAQRVDGLIWGDGGGRMRLE